MSKNPNRKWNDDDDDDDENGDADDETLRRGCCVKRRASHESSLGGGAWNWTFRAERGYLGPKRKHPTMPMAAHDLIHLNRPLEVYIVKLTHSGSTNSNVSFCGTYGCSNLSLSSHRWVLGKWMSKNPNFKSNDDGDEEDDDDDDVDDDGDDDETLRRGCCVKRLTRHMARVPFGGGGSLSPGRSRIRGPARPFASQSKTQGSPLGGYLS